MSDLGPMPAGVHQARINHELVAILQRALDDAKAGKIIAGAAILVDAENILNARTPIACPPTCTTTIIASIEFLKEEIIGFVRQAQRGGGRAILRAGALPTRQ